MKTNYRAGTAALLIAAGLTGCAGGLSGLNADNGFRCKAPDGVMCTSMAGISANLRANNLPGQHTKTRSEDDGKKSSGESQQYGTAKIGVPGSRGYALAPGAIRSEPETIRIWAAWWEDDEGDLNEESKVYLVVNPGRWLIEHNARQVEDEYGPARISSATPGGANRDTPIKPPGTSVNTQAGAGAAGQLKKAPQAIGAGAVGAAGAQALPQTLQNLAETMKMVQGQQGGN
ncbi:TraV family lipoprotein [Aquabacterium sp. NJ1]|uniref:TraV family lipoprotein n=1 Tax=Aquabacterium sp. NJ1 TaxID=1538295 RepID=UPI000691F3D9|nr:TraV family lipoprotein [Aquabacterium sp. NJ1]